MFETNGDIMGKLLFKGCIKTDGYLESHAHPSQRQVTWHCQSARVFNVNDRFSPKCNLKKYNNYSLEVLEQNFHSLTLRLFFPEKLKECFHFTRRPVNKKDCTFLYFQTTIIAEFIFMHKYFGDNRSRFWDVAASTTILKLVDWLHCQPVRCNSLGILYRCQTPFL